MSDQIAATIEQHGYVLPGGVCACGLDLNAPHGGYQKWWRAHLAAEIRQALTAENARLRTGIEALVTTYRRRWDEEGDMEAHGYADDLIDLLNPPTEGCNCGFGGFHDDVNPRCRLNRPTEGRDRS